MRFFLCEERVDEGNFLCIWENHIVVTSDEVIRLYKQ